MRTIVAAAIGWLSLLSVTPARSLEASNLDLVTQTASQAVQLALQDMKLPSSMSQIGDQIVDQIGDQPGSIAVQSTESHAANWLFEHLLIEELLHRGLEVTSDQTTATKLMFRVVDLGVKGQTGLLGGTVTRRCRVVLRLELRNAGELVWSGDGHAEKQDKIPKGELDALQHARFGFARTDLEQRTWGKYVEPLVISTVLGSLVYLFFSNR